MLGVTGDVVVTPYTGTNALFRHGPIRVADDRRDKGSTVIQIVAGLYPDMPAFDERGLSDAGQP